MSDLVNSPSHYASSEIECIDAIKAQLSPEEYKGYLRGNVVKYVWRYRNKGVPVQDLNKASVYLEWLLSEIEKDELEGDTPGHSIEKVWNCFAECSDARSMLEQLTQEQIRAYHNALAEGDE